MVTYNCVEKWGASALPFEAAEALVALLDEAGSLDLVEIDWQGSLEGVAVRNIPDILDAIDRSGMLSLGGYPAEDVKGFFLEIRKVAKDPFVDFVEKGV